MTTPILRHLAVVLLFCTFDTPFSPVEAAQNPFAAGPPIIPSDLVNSTACSKTLFEDVVTSYGTVLRFPYTPPVGDCAGPWDRVVLRLQGKVNGTVQFDRVGALWFGSVEIARLTTPEPPGQAIEWNVQRDLTTYSPIFNSSAQVAVEIDNEITEQYNGYISLTAKLDFYKDVAGVPALPAADYVVGLFDSPGSVCTNAWSHLGIKGNENQTTKIQLPFRNARRAHIDLYATGHNCEEFWYGNAPQQLENATGDTCGGGSEREFLLAIDGIVVGARTPFPVIYTGGVNPLLWRPQTGVYSFNVPPYFFDVTPFLPILNDGAEHELAVWVQSNSEKGSWFIDPVLVVTRDMDQTTIGGLITEYEFTLTNGPDSISIPDVEWNTSYTSNLFVETQLTGSDNQPLARETVTLDVTFSNNNTFFPMDGAGVTDMNVLIKSVSSAYERDDIWEYPFHLDSSYNQNASGFIITANITYGSRLAATGRDELTYSDIMAGNGTYARFTINNESVVIEDSSTAQGYLITEDASESCFFQAIQSADGFVNKSSLVVGQCIPSYFCAVYNACADPDDVVIPSSATPPLVGHPEAVPHPHRCHLKNCPTFRDVPGFELD